jgi:hypothetical protein
MARSRSRGAGARKGGGESRSTKSKKKAAPAVAEVEVVEESAGLSIDDGIPMVTTLVLLVAILVTDYVLGTHYGEGLFFK